MFTVQDPELPEKLLSFTPRNNCPGLATRCLEVTPTVNGGPLPTRAMRDQHGDSGAGNRGRTEWSAAVGKQSRLPFGPHGWDCPVFTRPDAVKSTHSPFF